jgi:hypothetical protein
MGFPALLASSDRAVLQHLGGTVVYAPSDGEPVEVPGIFDAAWVRVDAGQAGVISSGPAVFLRLADLPLDPETDEPRIEVDGKMSRVREVHKDGQGGVILELHVVLGS